MNKQMKLKGKIIGLDIGGANLKYSDEYGRGDVIYFPMWLKFDELESQLIKIKENSKGEIFSAVITAELSDAFKSKSEGIKYISDVLKKVFDRIYFLNISGNLKKEIDSPLYFSASNWIASTLFLKKEFNEFIFVDMGSTTTDIIPVKEDILADKTDFGRLKKGELYYAGLLRTPPYYILPEYNGIPLSSEYFAVMGDVMVITGDISEEDYTVDTPDGRGKEVDDCSRRIARLFCADVEEIGEEFLKAYANACRDRFVKILGDLILSKMKEYKIGRVIACGIGEPLIKKAVKEIEGIEEYISLKKRYGRASDYFPAFAVANLVKWMV